MTTRSLGQFYPVSSPVHALDPRAKLLATAVFVVGLFLIDSMVGLTLFEWGFLEVHSGGLRLGFFLALRILLLVSSAGLLTATTAPVALADGIEDLLSPLKKVRFPAHEVAMMMTIALRFIPTLGEEAEKIKGAQAARGADFSEGGPIRRARSFIPVLIPLTVGAFRRADELADAMESRGYRGGEGRTRYRELRFRVSDALALALTLFILLVGILL
jgi:energy-coupling factor transport system permease protein